MGAERDKYLTLLRKYATKAELREAVVLMSARYDIETLPTDFPADIASAHTWVRLTEGRAVGGEE